MSHPQQPPGGAANPSGSAYPAGTVTADETRRRRTVVAVVLAVVGVLAVVLATTAVALSVGGDDEGGGGAAVAGAPATASVEPTPTESEPEPTPTTEAPAETESPEAPEPPAPPPSGGRLKAAEYTDDWEFRLGDVELDARHVRGWDHATCAPVAQGPKLGQLGCRYAVEVTYRALGGKLQFTHLFLALPTAKAAERAVNQDKITDADFSLRDGSFLPGYEIGKYRDNAGSNFVVVTVATAKAGVREKQLDDYLSYASTDFTSALLFRF